MNLNYFKNIIEINFIHNLKFLSNSLKHALKNMAFDIL